MDCSASVAPPLPPATDFLLSSSDEAEIESLEEANPNLDFFKLKIIIFGYKRAKLSHLFPPLCLSLGVWVEEEVVGTGAGL